MDFYFVLSYFFAGKQEIREFLRTVPDRFLDALEEEEEKVNIVRTKVYNEKSKLRQKIKDLRV